MRHVRLRTNTRRDKDLRARRDYFIGFFFEFGVTHINHNMKEFLMKYTHIADKY